MSSPCRKASGFLPLALVEPVGFQVPAQVHPCAMRITHKGVSVTSNILQISFVSAPSISRSVKAFAWFEVIAEEVRRIASPFRWPRHPAAFGVERIVTPWIWGVLRPRQGHLAGRIPPREGEEGEGSRRSFPARPAISVPRCRASRCLSSARGRICILSVSPQQAPCRRGHI